VDGADVPVYPEIGEALAEGQQETIVSPHSELGVGQVDRYKLNGTEIMEDVLRRVAQDARVQTVEPNWHLREAALPNDPKYTSGQQWGMSSETYATFADSAWNAGYWGCGGQIVAIIDGPVYRGHVDLAPHMWVSPYEPVNGRDDDGNGKKDDNLGWDFVHNDRSIFNGTNSASKHGTHVAGIIAGVGNNGKGVAGVCLSGIKIIPLMVLKPYAPDPRYFVGTAANVAKALWYILDLKNRHGLPIAAINMSLTMRTTVPDVGSVVDALRAIGSSSNMMVVTAAGNDSINLEYTTVYPASLEKDNEWMISVSSLTRAGYRSSFSNYGLNRGVTIGAPGDGILSTVPNADGTGSAYALKDGTSQAAPFVSGAIALYRALKPNASPFQIKQALINSRNRTPPSGVQAWDIRNPSEGRLNIYEFLRR
jgi:subtilisin family serine protease